VSVKKGLGPEGLTVFPDFHIVYLGFICLLVSVRNLGTNSIILKVYGDI